MYLSEQEKSYKTSIDGRVARQPEISVNYYISDGNRMDVFVKGKHMMCGLDLKSGYYVIHALANLVYGIKEGSVEL